MTTIPNADGTSNLIEEDNDDLYAVKEMLDAQPKSRSPGAGRENVKKIMEDQQNVL